MIEPILFLVAVLAILAVSVLFIVKARRPSRAGQTPHCRQCDYNLTGATSEKCPECGHPLQPHGIVLGEKQPTYAWLAGLCACIVALIITFTAAPQINWRTCYPTAWLITNLSSANPTTAQNAWTELQRREKAGQLSAAQRSRLFDACLKVQAAPTVAPPAQAMFDYLGQACLDGQLSIAQQAQFCKQIVILTLRIRHRIVQGDRLHYEITYTGRGPSSGFWLYLKRPEPTYDDQKRVGEGFIGTSPNMTLEISASSVLNLPESLSPGRHRISFNHQASFYAGPRDDAQRSRLLATCDLPLIAEVEILPTAPPNFIRHNTDSTIARDLQARITPMGFQFDTQGGAEFQGHIQILNPPVPIAFDVFLRVNGTEYKVGQINRGAKSSIDSYLRRTWENKSDGPAPKPFNSCDVILRASEKVARETIDLYEFWDGELVYNDVRVTLKTPAAQPVEPKSMTDERKATPKKPKPRPARRK